MKKYIIALFIMIAVASVYAQITPQGDNNRNTAELHGTDANTGNPVDHSWDESADNDGDGEPDSAVFVQDMNPNIAGLQNASQNAAPNSPYGPKTVVNNGTRIYADGTMCTYYTHVQDLQQNPWMGLITVVEFCCEDMNAQWGPHCYWNVYYQIVNSWQGTSGQLSDASIDAAIAASAMNGLPHSSGPRNGHSQ